MSNRRIEFQPIVVYSILTLILLGLFLFGMKKEHDKSELTRLKKDEVVNNKQIQELKNSNSSLSEQNSSLNNSLSEKNEIITRLNENYNLINDSINKLLDSIGYLHSHQVEVATDNNSISTTTSSGSYNSKNNITYSTLRFHGKVIPPQGNELTSTQKGTLTVYNSCSYGGYVKVYIDDSYEGLLMRYYNEPMQCPWQHCVAVRLRFGWHKIKVSNMSGARGEYKLYIEPEVCHTLEIKCL